MIKMPKINLNIRDKSDDDDDTRDFKWYIDHFRMDVMAAKSVKMDNPIPNFQGIEPTVTWSSYIERPGSQNKQWIYLGTYSTKEEAIEARDEAEKGLSSYGDRDL